MLSRSNSLSAMPPLRHSASWRHASSMTHRWTAAKVWVCSASGTKLSARSRPSSGCCQRSSASTATIDRRRDRIRAGSASAAGRRAARRTARGPTGVGRAARWSRRRRRARSGRRRPRARPLRTAPRWPAAPRARAPRRRRRPPRCSLNATPAARRCPPLRRSVRAAAAPRGPPGRRRRCRRGSRCSGRHRRLATRPAGPAQPQHPLVERLEQHIAGVEAEHLVGHSERHRSRWRTRPVHRAGSAAQSTSSWRAETACGLSTIGPSRAAASSASGRPAARDRLADRGTSAPRSSPEPDCTA